MTTPRGIRNNNPGNIRYVEGITSTYQGCTGSDGAFCIFDTPQNGLRALCVLLLTYQTLHGLNTVRGIINRWAPPVENNTSAYVVAVAKQSGLGEDIPLDLKSPGVLAPLATAIIQHENGQQPYLPALITDAAYRAMGLPPPSIDPGAPAAPAPVPTPQQQPTGARMPILALISAFGPLLAQLIPQIAKAVNPQSEKTQQVLSIAQTVFDAVTTASGAPNVQGAIEALQRDPALVQTVTKAVINDPVIMGLVEIGGGIAAAREADQAMAKMEQPFWKVSQAFWITVICVMPPVDFMVYTVVSKMEKPSEQLITQIVTGLLSLIAVAAAYYFGTTQSSKSKDDAIANLSAKA